MTERALPASHSPTSSTSPTSASRGPGQVSERWGISVSRQERRALTKRRPSARKTQPMQCPTEPTQIMLACRLMRALAGTHVYDGGLTWQDGDGRTGLRRPRAKAGSLYPKCRRCTHEGLYPFRPWTGIVDTPDQQPQDITWHPALLGPIRAAGQAPSWLSTSGPTVINHPRHDGIGAEPLKPDCGYTCVGRRDTVLV